MLTPKDLDKMCRFFHNVDGMTFRKMFIHFGGNISLANHLWKKYNEYDRDIGKFIGSLDSFNQRRIAKMINVWKGLSYLSHAPWRNVKIIDELGQKW